MEIIHNIDALKHVKRPVVTIGSFDGVHLAHRKIIKKVVGIAENIEGQSVIVTFDPHPRQVVYPQAGDLELISTMEEKAALLADLGVDFLLVVPFTIEFSRMSPEEYLEHFIIEGLHPKAIVLGYDHRFGLNRMGNIDLFEAYQKQGKFAFHVLPKQLIEDQTISSSEIRRALKVGNVERAKALLGRPYNIRGKVVRGMQVGRTLGFPTANLQVSDPNKLIPAFGIYAVEIEVDGSEYKGMLYIGTKPTLEGKHHPVIEIHIFDFNRDVYGQELNVRFLAFIREDKKFDNLEELKKAIEGDRSAVLSYFNKITAPLSASRPKTAVVILNYNGLNYLKEFLPMIQQHLGRQHKIIIADNASTDASVEYLQLEHPEVQLLELPQNYGFAGGYNRALESIDADYYVLLNSDIEVTSDWVTPLITEMQNHPDIICAQPRVISWKDQDRFEYAGAAGGWIDALGYPFCRGRILESTELDKGQYQEDAEVFWATGAAMIVRARLFLELGGFDDWFFAHQEEIDFCWRAKRAGYRVMAFPKYKIFHVGGGTLSYSSPRKTFLNFRNSLAMLLKNEQKKHVWWKFFARLILDGAAGGYFAFKGEFNQVWAVIRSHFSLYKHLPVIWRQRRTINKKIERNSIGPSRADIGRYKGSIVFNYYFKGIHSFSGLPGMKKKRNTPPKEASPQPHLITK